MKRVLALALTLAALAAVQPAQAAKHPGTRCSVARSKTLFENPKARVFTRTYGADRAVRTQVCRKSDGKHFGLAQDVAGSSRQRVTLIGAAGDWLSYAVTVADAATTSGRACRFKIAAGSRRCSGGLTVHGIGVTAAGTLAWLANSGIDPSAGPFCCTVYRLNAGARHPDELDHGQDIESDSLAVAPHFAYWTKAGEPKSAPLR